MTPTCPYCRAPIEPEDESTVCEACATPHHADCYAENGGCTVFGCANAPADAPAISITASEINAPVRPPVAAAPPRPSTPPPPPRANSTSSVPPPPRPYTDLREDTTRYLTPTRGMSFGGYNSAQTGATIPPYINRRSRLTYILLGVLLGAFGGHNFYAGYIKRAMAQLLLTVLSCFFAAIISWIWAIIEVCIVTQDDDGVAFI